MYIRSSNLIWRKDEGTTARYIYVIGIKCVLVIGRPGFSGLRETAKRAELTFLTIIQQWETDAENRSFSARVSLSTVRIHDILAWERSAVSVYPLRYPNVKGSD